MGDPRNVLAKAIQRATDMGYKYYVGPECEFFLFHTDEDGEPTTITHDKAGYFDLGPMDLGENARRDMIIALQDMDYEIEASHHEVAPGQHEIDFKYSDAMSAADNIVTFKLVVKVIAQRHGLHATFMPKPIFGINGSGMHINQSLFSGDKNTFFDENDSLQLSQEAYYFIGGLMKHVKGMAALTNPTVNSYKRLVPGYEAPVYIAWSASNRSNLVRIPASRGLGTRVEMRNPDPSANPYLALAALLTAGLDGIENKINPPKSSDINLFKISADEKKELGIDNLPGSLFEALQELSNNEVIKEAIGEHVYENFVKAKMQEWDEYRTNVSEWEIETYISKY